MELQAQIPSCWCSTAHPYSQNIAVLSYTMSLQGSDNQTKCRSRLMRFCQLPRKLFESQRTWHWDVSARLPIAAEFLLAQSLHAKMDALQAFHRCAWILRVHLS